ncbi:hypothetical protein ACFXDE_13260 [Kitasatospora sp. NPDC059408]|uniref:hypothetical protein n=1 Tax=Kitasatospora sp. NPDC059408 TaxID=3346823 RepID=UPI0036A49523
MHRFHFRGFRTWAWLLLLICGAAFAFVQDDRPQYTGAAVGALCAATVLFVVSAQEEEPWDGAPLTLGDRLAGLAFGAGLWLLGGFLLLGCVLAVRFLVGLL